MDFQMTDFDASVEYFCYYDKESHTNFTVSEQP